jgi:hypothetical protein
MHYDINDVPVRIEKIALLSNPTGMNQAELVFTLSRKGIAAHITDTGDVYVSVNFLNDLAMYSYVDQEMETFIMKNKVDNIVFVESMITRR